MSQVQIQLLEVALIALCFIVLIYVLARRGRLSFRYTVGWLTLFFVAATGGLIFPLIDPLAKLLQVSTLTVFLTVSIVVLLLICIQLSISISGLQRQLQKIAEDQALSAIHHQIDNA